MNAEKLTNDILEAIATYGDRDSISSVMESLRERGWKRLGSISDFENICKSLGFRLEREYSKSGNLRVTYVTI